MSVKVSKEPSDMPYGHEHCVRCGGKTAYWWRDGVMPLHVACAKSVTEEQCESIARTLGFMREEGDDESQ